MGICGLLAWFAYLPYLQLNQRIILVGQASSEHHQLLPEGENFIRSAGQKSTANNIITEISKSNRKWVWEIYGSSSLRSHWGKQWSRQKFNGDTLEIRAIEKLDKSCTPPWLTEEWHAHSRETKTNLVESRSWGRLEKCLNSLSEDGNFTGFMYLSIAAVQIITWPLRYTDLEKTFRKPG